MKYKLHPLEGEKKYQGKFGADYRSIEASINQCSIHTAKGFQLRLFNGIAFFIC